MFLLEKFYNFQRYTLVTDLWSIIIALQTEELFQLLAMGFFKRILPKVRKLTEKKTSDGPETAIQQVDAIFNLVNWFAYIVGMEMRSDWKFNLRTTGNMLVNLWFAWTGIYTLYMLFPSVDSVIMVAGCIFTSTIMIKFSLFVFNHRRFLSVVNFIYEVANKNVEGRKHLILLDTTKRIFYYFKYIIVGIYLGGSVYMFYPVYDYVANGRLTPVSPLIFPFAADETTRSFLISTICNLFSPMWNSCGTVAINCLFIIFVEMYGALIAFIEDDFRTFDGMWRMDNKEISGRRNAFRNILMEIMDAARYNLLMNELFRTTVTIQIGCCFFTISTLLFGYLALGFVGGFRAAIYFLTELMILCFIGQLMDNQNEKIEMYSATLHRQILNMEMGALRATLTFKFDVLSHNYRLKQMAYFYIQSAVHIISFILCELTVVKF